MVYVCLRVQRDIMIILLLIGAFNAFLIVKHALKTPQNVSHVNPDPVSKTIIPVNLIANLINFTPLNI